MSEPALNLESQSGAIVTVNADGTVTVNRCNLDEASKLFWSVVSIDGKTYVQRILELSEQVKVLELQVAALSLDPFRSIVHGSPYEIRSHMHPVERETVSAGDIKAVLDTINQMACKAIQ